MPTFRITYRSAADGQPATEDVEATAFEDVGMWIDFHDTDAAGYSIGPHLRVRAEDVARIELVREWPVPDHLPDL